MSFVIVSGGTSGIGKACVLNLVRKGYNVAFSGRNQKKCEELVSGLSEAERKQIFFSLFDASDKDSVNSFVGEAVKKFGEVKALVNCVGANTKKDKVCDIDLKDLNEMYQTNVVAPFNFMKSVHADFLKQGKGLVINIMTSCCLFENPGTGSYSATKSAFEHLSAIYRKEERDNNIRVCHIYPGGVDTPFRAAERPDYLRPEDISNVVEYILTVPESVYLDDITLRPQVEKNF